MADAYFTALASGVRSSGLSRYCLRGQWGFGEIFSVKKRAAFEGCERKGGERARWRSRPRPRRAPDALREADEVRQRQGHRDVPARAPASRLRHRIRRRREHWPSGHRAHRPLDVAHALGEAREEVSEQEIREADGLERREHPPERREEEAAGPEIQGVHREQQQRRKAEVQQHGLRGGHAGAAGRRGRDQHRAAGEHGHEARGGDPERIAVGEMDAGVVRAEERLGVASSGLQQLASCSDPATFHTRGEGAGVAGLAGQEARWGMTVQAVGWLGRAHQRGGLKAHSGPHGEVNAPEPEGEEEGDEGLVVEEY